MRILLDTFYLYRLMADPEGFSNVERGWFGKREVAVHVSAVSIWEMRLKYRARRSSGNRKSPYDPNKVIAAATDLGMTFLAMTANHAARELDPPLAHKDPFDELLLVQAQEEGLRLLTSDRGLIDHPLALTARHLLDRCSPLEGTPIE